MSKVICIYSFQESSWVSCQKIVFNLLSSYRLVKDLTIIPFNYDSETTQEDLLHLVALIQEERPEKIVILDHKPHPLRIFQTLSKSLNGKLPPLIVHLFGDFTLYYREWVQSESFLKDQKVTFVVPSERQGHLVNKYLQNAEAIVCPFPVDEEEFQFDENLRKKQRQEWNVDSDETIFVYTGRLSRQKRIHTLISAFEKVALENPRAHLYFYGQTDHLGDQFLNIWETEGEYLIRLVRLHEKLPEEIRARVHFMGNGDAKKLKAVYSGADYFVSLSVHNDEDYGMSIAEAQAAGLPVILSDWGGFGSFELKDYPEAVRFISVKIGRYHKLVSKQETIEELRNALERKTDREKIAALSMESKSVRAVKRIIERILTDDPPKFRGFDSFLHFAAGRIEFRLNFYMNKKQEISKYYKKIYASYLRHH